MDQIAELPHEQVAAEVRAALARRRMSGRAAAREIGWKPAYIGRRLSGETPFDVNDLMALAALLDVPVSAFFEGVSYGTTTESSGSGHEISPLTSSYMTLALAEHVPVVTRAA